MSFLYYAARGEDSNENKRINLFITIFVLVILQLPQGYINNTKRGTAMPRLNLKVVGNP